jgi:hypothetical protein
MGLWLFFNPDMQGEVGGLIGGKKMIGIKIIAEKDIEFNLYPEGMTNLKKGETLTLIEKQLEAIKTKTHLGEKIKTYIYKYIFISSIGLLVFMSRDEFERLATYPQGVVVVYDENQRI